MAIPFVSHYITGCNDLINDCKACIKKQNSWQGKPVCGRPSTSPSTKKRPYMQRPPLHTFNVSHYVAIDTLIRNITIDPQMIYSPRPCCPRQLLSPSPGPPLALPCSPEPPRLPWWRVRWPAPTARPVYVCLHVCVCCGGNGQLGGR